MRGRTTWPGVGCPISRKATSILLAVAAVLGAVLLASCGGSKGSTGAQQSLDDVLAAVQGLSGKARADKLAALADEEGGS